MAITDEWHERFNSAIDLVSSYRPFVPKGQGKVWHDQIKSLLFMIGSFNGAAPITEMQVRSTRNSTRERPGTERLGIQRIDEVWFYRDRILAGFEVDSQVNPNSIRKLMALGAPLNAIVSGSGSFFREEYRPRLLDTGIVHCVVSCTDDYSESVHSVERIVASLVDKRLHQSTTP